MRSAFYRSISLAAVVLATGVAFATPLPDPPFSNGGVVPSSITYKQEYNVSKVLTKYAVNTAKCDYKAVIGLQLAYEPNNATKIAELQALWTACRTKVADRYVVERDRLLLKGTPACLDQAGIDAVRAQIDAQFPLQRPTVFCDGDAAAPDPATGLNIPDFKNEAEGEGDVAKLLIKVGPKTWKCYLNAAKTALRFGGTIPPLYMPKIEACFDKVAAYGAEKVATLDQTQKLPDCMPPATAQGLVDTAIDLAGEFTDEIFCASPSGAFLD